MTVINNICKRVDHLLAKNKYFRSKRYSLNSVNWKFLYFALNLSRYFCGIFAFLIKVPYRKIEPLPLMLLGAAKILIPFFIITLFLELV